MPGGMYTWLYAKRTLSGHIFLEHYLKNYFCKEQDKKFSINFEDKAGDFTFFLTCELL